MTRAVAAGFHEDTSEQEATDLLVRTVLRSGVTTEKVTIKCPANPITHVFLQFVDLDERDKFVRSANRQICEARGRVIRFTPAMDAEERYHQKGQGYVKLNLYEMHGIPVKKTYINRELKHVSIQGEVAIKTCANEAHSFHKHHDIEGNVEEHMDDWLTKNSSRRL